MEITAIIEEFIEYGQINNSLNILEYGAKIKEVCDRHNCSLDEALFSIRKATAKQVENFYIKDL